MYSTLHVQYSTVYRGTATTACVKVLTLNQWQLIITYISVGNVNLTHA